MKVRPLTPYFKVSLQKPKTEHEQKLFAAMKNTSLDYCKKLAENILNEILQEEEIKYLKNSRFEDKLKLLQANEDALIYNVGFVQTAILLHQTNHKNKGKTQI